MFFFSSMDLYYVKGKYVYILERIFVPVIIAAHNTSVAEAIDRHKGKRSDTFMRLQFFLSLARGQEAAILVHMVFSWYMMWYFPGARTNNRTFLVHDLGLS